MVAKFQSLAALDAPRALLSTSLCWPRPPPRRELKPVQAEQRNGMSQNRLDQKWSRRRRWWAMRTLRLHKRKRDAKEAAAVKARPSRKRKSSAPTAGKAKRIKMSELEAEKEEVEVEGFGDYSSVLQLSWFFDICRVYSRGVMVCMMACFEAGPADVPEASTWAAGKHVTIHSHSPRDPSMK